MFHDSVTYTDWDDNVQTEDLWFNITKSDLAGDLSLIERVQEMEKNLKGPERQLTTPEVQEILDLVKTFMALAYGVRDGKHFRKSPQIWEDFKSTAAYDEYLFGLFQDPGKAFGFILNALPKELRQEAKKAVDSGKLTPAEQEVASQMMESPSSVDNRPQWLIDGRAPSEAELVDAPREYLVEAFKLKNQS